MEGLTSQLSKLNPLSKTSRRRHKEDDDDDVGEEVDGNTVAGGGHGGRQSAVTKSQLRVSHAVRSFLVKEGVLSSAEAGLEEEESESTMTEALRDLLTKPHMRVPPEVTDRSHPLPAYFVSSSHNTYLLGHQLAGTSSASAYETALNTGSRCVEIDAWDGDENEDEPKVTHGYTLVSNIPFRAVCETIRDVVDREAAAATQQIDDSRGGYGAAPILLSLENHCGPRGQRRLVEIMNEVFAHRLLSKPVREKGHEEQEGGSDTGEHVSLAQLGSKIAVIVEYHLPDEASDSSSSDSSGDEEEDAEERQAHAEYNAKKKKAAEGGIIPELAELGVYAQSVKPRDNSWFEEVAGMKDGPHHHLINVSETGLAAHLPAATGAKEKIARHNSRHLMRVFPKGTRISSKNLHPVPFWGVGAQICAMNWQTFGAGMQLNEALFSGTEGYVLKPACLRGPSSLNSGRKKILRLHVAGATGVPLPPDQKKKDEEDEDEIRPYVTCTLVHPDNLDPGALPKRKTKPYRRHRFTGFLHRGGENPPPTDPLWDETLEWEYDDDRELGFLRILIKSDASFAANPLFAVAAVRLLYVVPGAWRFIRMLDLKGHETGCSLLVKFDVDDL